MIKYVSHAPGRRYNITRISLNNARSSSHFECTPEESQISEDTYMCICARVYVRDTADASIDAIIRLSRSRYNRYVPQKVMDGTDFRDEIS